jgi:hypothetical protein
VHYGARNVASAVSVRCQSAHTRTDLRRTPSENCSRTVEVYELVCHACRYIAELLIAAVHANISQCSHGARLEIR